jgi:hypothetical protein
MEKRNDVNPFERLEIFILRLALFLIFLMGIGLILFEAFKHIKNVVSVA